MPLPILPILLALAVAGSRKRAQPANEPKRPPTTQPQTSAPAPAPAVASAAQEAQNLSDYLRGGGSFGSKGLPSAEVLRIQRVLGVKPDGIVGPATRNKCRALGVVLPLRPTTRAPESRLTDGGQS